MFRVGISVGSSRGIGRTALGRLLTVPTGPSSLSRCTVTAFRQHKAGGAQQTAFLFLDHRCFSASSNDNNLTDETATTTTGTTTSPTSDLTNASVEETLDKLFAENAPAAVDAADALQTAVDVWSPVWYNVADQAIVAVRLFHEFSGFEYGWSIVGVTAVLRFTLFPVMIMAQRTSSRMAHIQPELNQMKERYEALGTPTRQDQQNFSKNISALFKRYDVKPLRAFIAPVIQLPLFMGMFFGLQKMDRIYPEELANGGMFWFPDLTAPDPYAILPILSGVTFLGMLEMGKDQMTATGSKGQGLFMLNAFRIMSIAMVPFLMSFDTSMLCYWTANNTLTLVQTALLKQRKVRDALGIWEPPKPIPGQETPSLMDSVQKIINLASGKVNDEKEEIMRHNQAIETKKRAAEMMRQARQKRRDVTTRNTK
jgi:YidC/Oxa1 family membrane protein insertase